jgi:hypothetical protein
MAQVIEHLPSKHKSLSSNPKTRRKKRKLNERTGKHSAEEGNSSTVKEWAGHGSFCL